MIPATQTARRARIAELIETRSVRSQGELLELLAAEGIEVTQATLSRDLVELGAVKVRDGKALVYSLADESGRSHGEAALDRLRRLCEELLVTAESSGNLVVVRVPPGCANHLALVLDQSRLDGVLGTIAGDDTILLVTTAPDGGAALARRLLELAGLPD